MKVSVIATIKNEEKSLSGLLDSLCRQTHLPDEVVICDGGSTDQTLAILQSYQNWLPIQVMVAEGANISEGRNLAIAHATGDIIAATDAGVVLSDNWLADLIRPIVEEGATVVSGWFEAAADHDFEVVMGATVLPALSDIDPHTFLPSSRSIAFLKSAWEVVGGYPEWLDYSEDLVFDFELQEQFGSFVFAPQAIAYFRPRGNLKAFAKQYYLYARGDGKANLWWKRHLIRYVIYLVGLPVLVVSILASKWWGWLLLAIGGSAYTYRPAQRFWEHSRDWSWIRKGRGLALIPLIRLVGDVAKMAGYPVGVWWRLLAKGNISER